ncbi:hypothetical protein P3T73_07945 [Kiritimatiellota bacterium B12222]|nr:hypothetical protein P3T73_07945 [Kiritimatiellota bacterium B12222]
MKKGEYIKVLGLWLLVALISPQVKPRRYEGGLSKNIQAKEEMNHSALGIVLGEFRTSLSDMFYMQTENFLHYGVAFVPHEHEKHSEASEMVSEWTEVDDEAGEDEHAMHEGHDHEHIVDHDEDVHGEGHEGHEGHGHEHEELTVIPSAEHDFRAWVGEMHRAIKPWQAPGEAHRVASDAEVVPLFRMMTLADPHYVKGYQVGAYWIQQLDAEAASKFLAEGLQNNPDSFELYLMRGMLHLKQARSLGEKGQINEDNVEQRAVLLKAKADFQKSAALMLQVRPAQEIVDDEDQILWSEVQETDAMAATHLSVLLEQRVGDPEQAKRLAKEYSAAMPDHKKLTKLLQEGP